MRQSERSYQTKRGRLVQMGALGCLLLLASLSFVGPAGFLAWGENLALLEQREAQIAALKKERDALKNRVDLVDPEHADPDLVGEILRRNLNVVHPDEVVITLD